jgi:hypothetical protein
VISENAYPWYNSQDSWSSWTLHWKAVETKLKILGSATGQIAWSASCGRYGLWWLSSTVMGTGELNFFIHEADLGDLIKVAATLDTYLLEFDSWKPEL